MNDDELENMLEAPLEALPSEPSLPRICVRVHRLTLAQGQRIVKWALAVPDCLVLADVTLDSGARAATLQCVRRAGQGEG